jgi:hypothetical protein
MAHVVNISDPHDLRKHLVELDEAGLVGQQISNMGAIHVLEFVLENGPSRALITEMLGSLRQCLKLCEEVAIEKGFDVVHTPNQEVH